MDENEVNIMLLHCIIIKNAAMKGNIYLFQWNMKCLKHWVLGWYLYGLTQA